jgi:hypothetical protein
MPARITGRRRRKDPIYGALRPRSGNKPAIATAQHGSGLFPVPTAPRAGRGARAIITGTLHTVTVDLSGDLITDTESEMQMAMARQ